MLRCVVQSKTVVRLRPRFSADKMALGNALEFAFAMTHTLRNRILGTIRRHDMMRAGDRVAVGVSGGADSVALLVLLECLREELGIQLLVTHFNHQLRGTESDEDARFVAALATERGLAFVTGQADVAGIARREGRNLEDAARRLRYGFFHSLVETGRACRVAIAHTADDQAETVLAHLIRGTGSAGLAGIYPVVGSVVRPLLEIRRGELRDYLRHCGQTWREDSTNEDTTRTRARIRKRLLPLLEADFQPSIVQRLTSLAELCREEEAFWVAATENWLDKYGRAGNESVEFPAAQLLAPAPEPANREGGRSQASQLAFSRRIVRRVYERVRGEGGGLSSHHVEEVLRFAAESSSGQRIELSGHIDVMREFNDLVFCKRTEGKQSDPGSDRIHTGAHYRYPVEWRKTGESKIEIAEIGVLLHLKLIDWPPPPSETKGLGEVLDAERLCAPLEIRNWQPGDAYRPRGHRRIRKVKEMFQRQKVAGRERTGFPVLTCGGEIIWGRGLPVAAQYAARAGSKLGLVIAEEAL